MKPVFFPFILSALLLGCASSNLPKNHAFDVIFPKGSDDRAYYQKILNEKSASSLGRELHRDFYLAYYGNRDALKKFLHNPQRDEDGEYSETWSNDCLVLIMSYGDETFIKILDTEDKATQDKVYGLLEWFANHKPDLFPAFTRRIAEMKKENT